MSSIMKRTAAGISSTVILPERKYVSHTESASVMKGESTRLVTWSKLDVRTLTEKWNSGRPTPLFLHIPSYKDNQQQKLHLGQHLCSQYSISTAMNPSTTLPNRQKYWAKFMKKMEITKKQKYAVNGKARR
jgi:hypothetical protein